MYLLKGLPNCDTSPANKSTDKMARLLLPGAPAGRHSEARVAGRQATPPILAYVLSNWLPCLASIRPSFPPI